MPDLTIELTAPATVVVELAPATPLQVDLTGGAQGPSGASGGGPGAASFEFTQATAALVWTINHNLGYRPAVGVFTAGGVAVETDVRHITVNQVQVFNDTPLAGFATCS